MGQEHAPPPLNLLLVTFLGEILVNLHKFKGYFRKFLKIHPPTPFKRILPRLSTFPLFPIKIGCDNGLQTLHKNQKTTKLLQVLGFLNIIFI